MNVLAIAVVMISVASLLAAAPSGQLPSATPPARSPAPLSKYQRAKLGQYRNSAPADQYFGRLKLSFLGINNTFRDAAISAGDHTVDPSIVSKVEFADEALRDWASHFPHDPQLARSYFLAIDIERKIWLKPNQEEAWTYINRITTLFPTTYFGKLIKKDVAIGFTEHYYSDAVPCPTPTLTPEATPRATSTPVVVASAAPRKGPARPKATPTPKPTPTPTAEPTATPSPQPTPVPTPQVIAKGLKVQIETPACIRLPAPSPSGTPTPSPASSSASPNAAPQSAAPAPGATSSPAAAASPNSRALQIGATVQVPVRLLAGSQRDIPATTPSRCALGISFFACSKN